MAVKKNNSEERPVVHISDSQMAQESRDTFTKLMQQERVRFTVMPDGSGDKKIRVKINGTCWEYAVGKEQEAPRDVYELIATKYRALEAAESFRNAVANTDLGRL